VDEYGNCRDVIRNAQVRRSDNRGGGGGGAGPAGFRAPSAPGVATASGAGGTGVRRIGGGGKGDDPTAVDPTNPRNDNPTSTDENRPLIEARATAAGR